MTLDRALVLGGSIAGLLSAAALAPHADEIVIVDRDELLVDGPEARLSRRGVPQSEQVHHLLGLGRRLIDDLVPGFDDELVADGAEHFDEASAFAQYLRGVWRIRAHSDLVITCFQRPAFEWVIRRRVLALPNVRAVKGLVTGLTASADRRRVTGARVRGVDSDQISADLVVDGTGRGSRAPSWVQDLGYSAPLEAHLRVYMGYTTFDVEIPDGAMPHELQGVTTGALYDRPWGASIRPIDHGRHIIMCNGLMRHYPPGDIDGVREFLTTVPTPIFSEVLAQSKITSELRTYQMPGNQRRYWERLDARPENLVVVGDAVASFDPLFGQGMSTAAAGATVLGEAVADALKEGTLDGVATRVSRDLTPWVDIAFATAVGIDAGYPGAEFENLDRPPAASEADAQALAEIQSEDIDVMMAVRRATLYMDPSLTQTEEIRQKVADWQAQGRAPRPDMVDPTILPQVVA